MEDLRMMLLYFNSEKGMNYYYSNETQQIYAMKNKGSVRCPSVLPSAVMY